MLAAASAAAADKPDTLARARAYYNQRQFDAAVNAAEQARLFAAAADAADLIGARAYLERFRQSGSTDDLDNARDRLRRLDPQRLDAHERSEYVVGLGETLYFDGAYGAAADLFESILSRDGLAPEARERTLEWWASAVDEDAKPRPDIERQPMYQKIRDRMQRELGTNPASGSASYWLSAAARAQGNLQAAWDAAEAAWVRAPLTPDRGVTLRGDIDRLVLTAIVPERARMIAQTPDAVKAEWDQFKDRWNK
jgi:tetratricopeptide (TPR) repeat protein